MKWIEKEIVQFDADSFDLLENDLLENLESKAFPDLIIDCSKTSLSVTELKFIRLFQTDQNKCLVIVIPANLTHSFSENWIVVPSKKEAVDFILFERMQRDLGL